MQEGDRVILATAEPHWVHAKIYEDIDSAYNESNLKFLEEKVLGQRVNVYVFVAGDLHHYRCHAAADGTQKITAGGGGAFLHPTHRGWRGADLSRLIEKGEGELEQTNNNRNKACENKVGHPENRRADDAQNKRGKPPRVFTLQQPPYPTEAESRKQSWRNLLFPLNNIWFGLITGVLYWLTSWVLLPIVTRHYENWNGTEVFRDMFPNPAVAFWFTLVLITLMAFTDTHSTRYRVVAGVIHGSAHFAAMLLLTYLSYMTVTELEAFVGQTSWFKGLLTLSHNMFCYFSTLCWLDPSIRLVVRHLLYAAIIFFGGWVVGSFIMGLYLLISYNVFGRHYNEAFGALKVQDWKHFLRFKIDAQGGLTIYPIGIDKVPRQWEKNESKEKHPTVMYAPVGNDKRMEPKLIEDPISLPLKP